MLECLNIFMFYGQVFCLKIKQRIHFVVDDKLTLEERKNVFNGKIITVYSDTLTDDTGSIVLREKVVYPKVAAVVPITQEGYIILINQYRYGVGELLWEIPAGISEEGESTKESVIRELAEETGYEADTVEKIGSFYPSPGASTENVFLYRAFCHKAGEQKLDKNEDIREVRRFTKEQVKELIKDGKITDGKTLIGLYKIFCF